MNENDSIKNQVKQQFSQNAEAYVTSSIHAKGEDLSLMLEWARPESSWEVLDIATGGGHVAKSLSSHVKHVIAVDLTVRMLEVARKHLQESGCLNVSYVVSDAESLPFLDKSFDWVTCRIAAHHFPNPEKFVSEVSRVLRPGGYFIFIDNVSPKDHKLATFINTVEKLRDPSHVWCYSVEKWQEWFHESGLKESQSRLRMKTFEFPNWVRRTAESDNQIQQVHSYLLESSAEEKEAFSVEVSNGEVATFQTEEWMCLLQMIE